jgi:hypothetical protein
MFVICDIGTSSLPHTDVILLKHVTWYKDERRRRNFLLKDKFSRRFNKLLRYVKFVLTVDDSTLQKYSVLVEFASFKGMFGFKIV